MLFFLLLFGFIQFWLAHRFTPLFLSLSSEENFNEFQLPNKQIRYELRNKFILIFLPVLSFLHFFEILLRRYSNLNFGFELVGARCRTHVIVCLCISECGKTETKKNICDKTKFFLYFSPISCSIACRVCVCVRALVCACVFRSLRFSKKFVVSLFISFSRFGLFTCFFHFFCLKNKERRRRSGRFFSALL